MTTTALARPSDGSPTRSLAVVRRNDALQRKAARKAAQRRAGIVVRPGPSPEEERIVRQFRAWGLPIDGLLPLFGSAQLALPAPAVTAPPVTEMAVSVPLRDRGVQVVEVRAGVPRPVKWTRWQRFTYRALSAPDPWTRLAAVLVGVGGVVLLSVETHPWRVLGAAIARMDLGTVMALAFLAGPAVGVALGLGAALRAPRRTS